MRHESAEIGKVFQQSRNFMIFSTEFIFNPINSLFKVMKPKKNVIAQV